MYCLFRILFILSFLEGSSLCKRKGNIALFMNQCLIIYRHKGSERDGHNSWKTLESPGIQFIPLLILNFCTNLDLSLITLGTPKN